MEATSVGVVNGIEIDIKSKETPLKDGVKDDKVPRREDSSLALNFSVDRSCHRSVSAPIAAALGNHKFPQEATLTIANVERLHRKQEEKQALSDRMWRWLEASGPPFEVQPSAGVPLRRLSRDRSKYPQPKTHKKSFFSSCWCFSG